MESLRRAGSEWQKHANEWKRTPIRFFVFLYSFSAILLLSACSSMGTFSNPQQAAIQASISTMQQGAVVDTNSIQVRQTAQMDGKTFVMVSFQRQVENRHEDCLMMYEARRMLTGGWVSGSGGGGCSGSADGTTPEQAAPMDIYGGQSSGSRAGDPGHSNINGLVNQDSIVKVRVTWDDSQFQEVNVVSGSYLAIRSGAHTWKKVEGLDKDGQTVYSSAGTVAPGKQ